MQFHNLNKYYIRNKLNNLNGREKNNLSSNIVCSLMLEWIINI